MNRFFIPLWALASLLFTLPPSNATTIDFEEITQVYSGNSLDSKGYNFFNDCLNVPLCILHRDPGSPYNADPGGVTYAHDSSHSISTLTKIDGNAFDFISIDFADFLNSTLSQSILLVGTYTAGGTISQTVILSNIVGLETFFFGWEDLIQVTWTETTGNWLQLDNVIVQSMLSEPDISDISAPGTLALFGLGFIGFLTARRRLV